MFLVLPMDSGSRSPHAVQKTRAEMVDMANVPVIGERENKVKI